MPPDRLLSERLLATGESRAEFLLLHGWGSSRACWRPMLPALRQWCNVTLVDLPGLGGEGPALDLDSLLAAIVAIAPPRFCALGWSLGGQLATLLAARFPDRVQALFTLASNPRFTAEAGWPGAVPVQLAQVRQAHLASPERSLRRFEAVQTLSNADAPALRAALAACRSTRAESMTAGLGWLAELDLRDTLRSLALPQYHLLGSEDTLVPRALAPALVEMLPTGAPATVECLAGMGHALPLQCPERIAECVHRFLSQAGQLAPAAASGRRPLSKKAISASFSRAATTYDSVAMLQRDVGERLLGRLDAVQGEVGTVLDLGCGTGYFRPALEERFPGARYVGLDLALGMLQHARDARRADTGWVAGDAEQLPLAANSVDLVFSSLAIQWCSRPDALFSELARVLRPGGTCVFSTLGPATLAELRSAWAAVDAGEHVNDFLAPAELQAASARVGNLGLSLEQEPFRMYYQRVRDLVDELKTLGAHNVSHARPPGLGGRRRLAGMVQAYEAFREAGRLPASYEVIFGSLHKP